MRLTPEGRRLLVANGKGLTSKANRYGPRPGPDGTNSAPEYIGGLFQGTVAVIDLPAPDRFEERMRAYTERCLRGRPAQTTRPPQAGRQAQANPIPMRRNGASPIRYCIYIIKENRTYDQILGDLEKGNQDPSLCLFPEPVTPNHHELARGSAGHVACARRRNQFAGWHDLASGTRVITKFACPARPALALAAEAPANVEATPLIGPYHVLNRLGRVSEGELLLGFDAQLLRRVWILQMPPGTSLIVSRVSTANGRRFSARNGNMPRVPC